MVAIKGEPHLQQKKKYKNIQPSTIPVSSQSNVGFVNFKQQDKWIFYSTWKVITLKTLGAGSVVGNSKVNVALAKNAGIFTPIRLSAFLEIIAEPGRNASSVTWKSA